MRAFLHGPVAVFFSTQNKVGVKLVREYVKWGDANGCTHLIILAGSAATAFTRKEITSYGSSYQIEFFTYGEFAFCLAEHVRQPRHRLLSRAEVDALLGSLPCGASCKCHTSSPQTGWPATITCSTERLCAWTDTRMVLQGSATLSGHVHCRGCNWTHCPWRGG